MAKKSCQHTPPKPPQFTTTPFGRLKGVVVNNKSTDVELAQKTIPLPIVPPEENGTELFLQAMAGTRRLHQKNLRDDVVPVNMGVTPSCDTKAVTTVDDVSASELFNQEIRRLKLEVKFSEQIPDEDELKPLSGNRLKQLKRGIISVDHQLDLHGLTRDEALAELPRFLRSARLKGQVAVLVITGKGLNSPGEPVLQQAVLAWFRDAGRELVLEFAPAPREMGGAGAFVVFLRSSLVSPAKKSQEP